MTILLTGSRGKTALPLARLLSPTHRTLTATRSPTSPVHEVKFDWTLPETYRNPFTHPLAPITAIYLVGADVPSISTHVIEFIHTARKNGVNRFVLLSAWEVESGSEILMGKAHAEMKRLGDKEGVEWCVLRPQYFMENFLDYYLLSMRSERKLYTASGSRGKKAFISAQDIAAVAYRVLVDEVSHNREYILTGPDKLSDGDVADTISRITGRGIECVTLSETEFKQRLTDGGMPEWIAGYLALLDVQVAEGVFESGAVTGNVQKILGKSGRGLEEFVEKHREVWL